MMYWIMVHRWAVENGYGWESDLEYLEENGKMEEADSAKGE